VLDLARGVATRDGGSIQLTSIEDAIGTTGDDTMIGNNDANRFWGGPLPGCACGEFSDGDDVLRGGGGPDQVNGGTGADTLRGGSGADILRGGPGNDRLFGEQGSDVLRGGHGVDSNDGGSGHDTCVSPSRPPLAVHC